MEAYTYTQVEMVRGNIHQLSWIPSKFAVLGKVLKIKEKGVWEDGWQVIDVGGTLNADYVLSHERDYRTAFPSLTPRD